MRNVNERQHISTSDMFMHSQRGKASGFCDVVDDDDDGNKCVCVTTSSLFILYSTNNYYSFGSIIWKYAHKIQTSLHNSH